MIEPIRPVRSIGALRMVIRALGRRCPCCGDQRAWFAGWFRQGERCVGCGLSRTRNTSGHELGSMTIALILNIGLVVVAIAIAIIVTAPDIPVLTLSVVLAATAIIVPIVTWPISHTLWSAIDLRFRPIDGAESAEAAKWLAGRAIFVDKP